jgi:hypothetical protein
MHVAPLLDAVRARGFSPATVAMDMGYDNGRVYAESAERDVVPIIPLRRNSGHRESSIRRKKMSGAASTAAARPSSASSAA